MKKNCKQCKTAFEITAEDLKFYDKISPIFAGKKQLIPPPTLCPDCRLQRKLVWRNFTKLYNRKSDLSGKQFISIFSQDKPYQVYTLKEWGSDAWNPLSYGRDFDFSRPFFDQFMELHDAVPRPGTTVSQSENCEYTNATYSSKNCYLVFGCAENEDCYFSHILWYSKSCFDMLYSYHCEFCSECVDCNKCYMLHHGRECYNCSNSYYLFDCRNCKNCFGCVNLANREYCIFNKQYKKDEYEKLVEEMLDATKQQLVREKFMELYYSLPKRAIHITNCENVTGNHLDNSRNLENCFDILDSEDSKNCYTAGKFKDCYDCVHNGGGLELGYETFASVGYNLIFTRDSFSSSASNLIYCSDCNIVSDCFGCVGLHNKEKYCVFNKQYSKEEYEILVPKIIEHMQKTGEYGEFFPAHMSPFAYNESIAHEYFPLTREEAAKRKLKWHEEDKTNKYDGPRIALPAKMKDVKDEILQQILYCIDCGKNYRIIKQELEYHRQSNLPLPEKCTVCRHKDRMRLRNPRKLWDRACAKCKAAIRTSYAPDRPEIVYCESCYLKEVY